MSMDGYPAKIIEHAKHPRKFGRMSHPDLRFEEVNPLCGDRIRVEVRLTHDGAVEEISFSGEMCAIAKASASILFPSIEGMTTGAISDVSDEQVLTALGDPVRSHRLKCALLPILALRGAIQNGSNPRASLPLPSGEGGGGGAAARPPSCPHPNPLEAAEKAGAHGAT
jgi:nitrogen fixation NifU-like protein